MRRRIVGLGVFFIFALGTALLYEKGLQGKNSQELTMFPAIIKDSILRVKMPVESVNTGVGITESEEPEKREEERDFEEAELVEMIANPMLMKDAMLEDFIPFVSYTEAMDLEG